MAISFSLYDGVTTKTLSPLSSMSPRHGVTQGETINEAIGGGLQIVFLYTKRYDELTVNAVPAADADVINGWKQTHTQLTYTPNTDESGTTFSVLIINTDNPLNWMPRTAPDTFYEGTIMLREV